MKDSTYHAYNIFTTIYNLQSTSATPFLLHLRTMCLLFIYTLRVLQPSTSTMSALLLQYSRVYNSWVCFSTPADNLNTLLLHPVGSTTSLYVNVCLHCYTCTFKDLPCLRCAGCLPAGSSQYVCWRLKALSAYWRLAVCLLVALSLPTGGSRPACWWLLVCLLVALGLPAGGSWSACWWLSVCLLVALGLPAGSLHKRHLHLLVNISSTFQNIFAKTTCVYNTSWGRCSFSKGFVDMYNYFRNIFRDIMIWWQGALLSFKFFATKVEK